MRQGVEAEGLRKINLPLSYSLWRPARHFRRIAHRRLSRPGAQRHRERNLESRLVERRKGRAGIDRFKLAPRMPLVPDLRVGQAGGVLIERPVIREGERHRSGGKVLREDDPGDAGWVELVPGAGDRLTSHGGGDRLQRQIAAVEIDETAWAREPDFDSVLPEKRVSAGSR